jgi:hypothetical protein
MPYAIGLVLSLTVALFANRSGFDRDRAFYSTVLIVVASYYVLFATMGASLSTVLLETLLAAGFVVAAVIGFKSNMWIVAFGLAGHGVFDALHGYILTNPGMPVWWPAFCGTYDVGAGVVLAWIIKSQGVARRTAG